VNAKLKRVRCEQAVYGSFPFWHRGYDVLARSHGCKPEWLAALKSAAQRYGEPPAGAIAAGGLFAMRLEGGTWMVVGVDSPGCDDQGRPGALAFHALYLSRWTYWRAGADPFAFAEALRRDWSRADMNATLPACCSILRRLGFRLGPRQGPDAGGGDERLAAIVTALSQGRKVAIQSAEPAGALARQVWRALPLRVRLRASVATWAFDGANRFDFVAMPRVAGIARDAAVVIVTPEGACRA
jgi:hypothetical protein